MYLFTYPLFTRVPSWWWRSKGHRHQRSNDSRVASKVWCQQWKHFLLLRLRLCIYIYICIYVYIYMYIYIEIEISIWTLYVLRYWLHCNTWYLSLLPAVDVSCPLYYDKVVCISSFTPGPGISVQFRAAGLRQVLGRFPYAQIHSYVHVYDVYTHIYLYIYIIFI